MNAAELIRKIKKTGRRDRVTVEIIRGRGKGTHATLVYGDRDTTIPLHGSSHELPMKTVASILKDLGLKLRDMV